MADFLPQEGIGFRVAITVYLPIFPLKSVLKLFLVCLPFPSLFLHFRALVGFQHAFAGWVKLILVVARYRTVRCGRTVQQFYIRLISDGHPRSDPRCLFDRRNPPCSMRSDSFQTTLNMCKCPAVDPSAPYLDHVVVLSLRSGTFTSSTTFLHDRQQHFALDSTIQTNVNLCIQ